MDESCRRENRAESRRVSRAARSRPRPVPSTGRPSFRPALLQRCSSPPRFDSSKVVSEETITRKLGFTLVDTRLRGSGDLVDEVLERASSEIRRERLVEERSENLHRQI